MFRSIYVFFLTARISHRIVLGVPDKDLIVQLGSRARADAGLFCVRRWRAQGFELGNPRRGVEVSPHVTEPKIFGSTPYSTVTGARLHHVAVPQSRAMISSAREHRTRSRRCRRWPRGAVRRRSCGTGSARHTALSICHWEIGGGGVIDRGREGASSARPAMAGGLPTEASVARLITVSSTSGAIMKIISSISWIDSVRIELFVYCAVAPSFQQRRRAR